MIQCEKHKIACAPDIGGLFPGLYVSSGNKDNDYYCEKCWAESKSARDRWAAWKARC